MQCSLYMSKARDTRKTTTLDKFISFLIVALYLRNLFATSKIYLYNKSQG